MERKGEQVSCVPASQDGWTRREIGVSFDVNAGRTCGPQTIPGEQFSRLISDRCQQRIHCEAFTSLSKLLPIINISSSLAVREVFMFSLEKTI
jgi:hypothetical protein